VSCERFKRHSPRIFPDGIPLAQQVGCDDLGFLEVGRAAKAD
jgi:hypothetical protein